MHRRNGIRIRGIIFDLYDTLIYLKEDKYLEIRGEMAEAMGVWAKDMERVWRRYTPERFVGKIATLEEMVEVFYNELGRKGETPDMDLLHRLEKRSLIESAFPYPGMEEMLKSLKSQGYKLGLLSNASFGTRHLVEHFSWMSLFDVLLLSFEEKMVKPDAIFYHHIMNKMKISPHEGMFVGDGGSQEITGAKEVGLMSVRVVQPYQYHGFPRDRRGEDYLLDGIANLEKILEEVRGSED